jgi:membrane protein
MPREVAAVFRDHRLLIQASALGFRMLLALIPLLLFAVGLLGFLNLEEVWKSDLSPTARRSLSPAAFTLVDDAVTEVLTRKAVFWVTVGALIAVWEGSGVVRAAVRILNAIYEVKEERSDARRFLLSGLIAAAIEALVIVAIAMAPLAGEIAPDGALGFLVRVCGWILCALALLAAIGLLVRAAPDVERPLRWVSFGAVLVVVSWIVTTVLFWVYVTELASYESVFGHLATAFIGLEYLFVSATVLIGGLVVDSLIERRSRS